MLDPVVTVVTAIAKPIAERACTSFPTLECCDVLAEIHLALLERATGESLVSSDQVLAVANGVAARCMQEESRRLRMLARLRGYARQHPEGVLQ